MKSVLIKTTPDYEFYSDGRIWSFSEERFIDGNSDERGYNRVELTYGRFSRHRIMASVFMRIPDDLKGIPFEQLEVHHEDGDPSNNSVANLRIVTREQHMLLHEDERKTAAAIAKYTKVYQYGLDGLFIREWESIKEAEETLGISGVSQSCRLCIQAGGFQWRYEKYDRIPPLKAKSERISEARSIPIEMCTMDWEHEAFFQSSLECERQTGIPTSNIRKIIKGKRKYASTKDGKKHRFREIKKTGLRREWPISPVQ